MSWDVVTFSLFLILLMKNPPCSSGAQMHQNQQSPLSLSSGLTVKVDFNLGLQSVASFVLQVRSANSESDVHKVREHPKLFRWYPSHGNAWSLCDLGVKHLKVAIMFPYNRERRSQVADVLSSLDFSNPRHCTIWMVRRQNKLLF